MRFWDSSAVVPLLVDEPASASMKSLALADPDLTVWWATSTECISAVARRLRLAEIEQVVHDTAMARLSASRAQWSVVPPSEQLRDRAENLLSIYALRAADALQLAAAMQAAQDGPLGFVCLDERLRDAARSEGLIVEP